MLKSCCLFFFRQSLVKYKRFKKDIKKLAKRQSKHSNNNNNKQLLDMLQSASQVKAKPCFNLKNASKFELNIAMCTRMERSITYNDVK